MLFWYPADPVLHIWLKGITLS